MYGVKGLDEAVTLYQVLGRWSVIMRADATERRSGGATLGR